MRELALLLLLEDIIQRQMLDFSKVDELVEEVPHFVSLHLEQIVQGLEEVIGERTLFLGEQPDEDKPHKFHI